MTKEPRESATARAAGTSEYYERHALEYFDRTVGANMSHLYQPFISRLKPGAKILDAGAGSGRDLREFVRLGFLARGIDASQALAGIAARYSGAPCDTGRLEDLSQVAQFDGVWACASLLHVAKAALPDVLRRIRRALLPGGLLFVSVQEGMGEQVAPDGRLYTLYDEGELLSFLGDAGFGAERVWTTEDVLRDRRGPRWLNVLATCASSVPADACPSSPACALR